MQYVILSCYLFLPYRSPNKGKQKARLDVVPEADDPFEDSEEENIIAEWDENEMQLALKQSRYEKQILIYLHLSYIKDMFE